MGKKGLSYLQAMGADCIEGPYQRRRPTPETNSLMHSVQIAHIFDGPIRGTVDETCALHFTSTALPRLG